MAKPREDAADSGMDKENERKRQHGKVIVSKIPRLFLAPTPAAKSPAAKKKPSKIPKLSGIPRRRQLAEPFDSSSDGTISECPTTSSVTDQDDPFVATLRELDIARCLQEDLLRDNAKLKQQAEFIHTEIGFYYELLTQIEEVVQAERLRLRGRRILEIISAPMATPELLDDDKPQVPDDATF
ncbi:hypothetical protein ACHHYP_14417 [Achlya hypogyna]|uniref:Uncharacterized protein n=1 Tax=Achlya hypogyna TaxID=1202772 RepID=A0A1V9YD56_ACHHY|nr:hypothetical protein ACHHYP_14417 [Achlya hypogyna]